MEKQMTLEKRSLTFVLFLLRLISGLAGGFAGTLAALVAYFILINVVPAGEKVTSLSAFVVIIIAFVGTLSANTITALMVSFLDNEKYSRQKTTVTHIFLFNLILFFLTIPLYLIGISLGVVHIIAAVHFLLSAFISALIMEILAGYEYSLLGVYSYALGIFISIGLAMVALAFEMKPLIITFAAMPVVWFILQFVSGLSEMIYDNFIKYYGIDALSVQTDLGGDTEEETEEKDEDDEEPDED